MTFFARLTPAWSSCRRRFGKGCSSEDSLFHRTPLLRTGITSTGIFLHRRRSPDLADPKQPWNMLALTALHRFWVVPTRVPCYGRRGGQISPLYGTLCRSTAVFFLQDDHDHFDNDEATDDAVTFPPDNFMNAAG